MPVLARPIAPSRSWNSSHAGRGCSLEALRSAGRAGLFHCFAVLQADAHCY